VLEMCAKNKSWMERNISKDLLETVDKERLLTDSIRKKRRIIIETKAFRRTAEHNIRRYDRRKNITWATSQYIVVGNYKAL
jgi:hypothetical protein